MNVRDLNAAIDLIDELQHTCDGEYPVEYYLDAALELGLLTLAEVAEVSQA